MNTDGNKQVLHQTNCAFASPSCASRSFAVSCRELTG